MSTFNVITSWDGVTVSQFKEIFSFKQSDFDNIEEYFMQILSILCDTPISDIEEMDYEFLMESIQKILFINTLPNKPPKPFIKTDYGMLYLKDDFNSLTVGEFIDIENLMLNNHNQNLNLILGIFYRHKEVKNNPFYLDTYEPYGDWIYHRAPLFEYTYINDVYGVINKYLIFRKDFFERYAGLFDDSTVDEEDIDEVDSLSKSEKMKDEEKQKNIKKWSWDLLIYRLAKNDPIKFEEATTMSVIQAFNIFSMKKELGLE